MQHEKKYWEGYLNGDDADAYIQFTEYVNMQDFRFGTTSDKGFAKQLESVGSTLLIPNPLLPPVGIIGDNISTCIGVAHDLPNRRTIYFTTCPAHIDVIWCYDYVKQTIYKVLSTSDVIGQFNFEKDHLIHSARVENGCVYWTDNLNEPRRINIDAGINAYLVTPISSVTPYALPVSQSVISWIRRQPGLPPTQMKVQQFTPAITSQLANDAFLFSYRYIYRDYEISTLSGLSTLVNFNSDVTFENRINISIPIAETIDQDVIEVDLVATYLVSGVAFIIKSWRKVVSSEAAEIAAHNAGTTPLTYAFYNDTVGIALDSAYTNKIYDSVPRFAQTLEMAKNRSFLANYLIGYTTPTATSLTIGTATSTYTGSGTTVSGEWYLLKNFNAGGHPSTNYVLQTTTLLPGVPPGATYIFTWSGTVPPYPASINYSDLTFRGHTTLEAVQSIAGGTAIPVSYVDQGSSSVINTGGGGGGGNLAIAFKSNAAYQVSISFKDSAGRECGILTNSSLLFRTANTGLSAGTYVTVLSWALSNVNALSEIPVWAYYYSINLTKCLSTRFFVQSFGVVIYAAKDSSGNYTFTTTAYGADLAGVAIDLSSLNSYSEGYVFAQGDFVQLYVNSITYNLAIIGQSAQYIICGLQNVGSLASATAKFEIYTPYRTQLNEPHFEQGQIFPINNPGTITRAYSLLFGSLQGDVYIFRQTNLSQDYIVEAMNISYKHYQSWYTNAGRPNFVDYFGQAQKLSSIAYSNTYIPGTQNNGLSTFDALDTSDISPDFGPIYKLQLSSKVSKIGSVMLAICSGPTTASIYLGENTLISQTGDAVVAQANSVIGSVHELKGDFGTMNPESVIEWRGNIYWYDVQNGKIIQYADNGLFPISNYKVSRFWQLFSNQFKSMTAAQIEAFGYRPFEFGEAFGNRPFVFGCADPHHGELLFTVPQTLADPPDGYLPDDPTAPYPFDIWDGRGKTIVFKLFAEPNRWQGSYSFQGEYMAYMENNLISFRYGNLYLHNQTTSYCNYYGQQYSPKVMNLSNQQLNKPKSYNNYSAEANASPSYVYFYTKYPILQASDLQDFDFKVREGIFYATVYRNKLDPAFMDTGEALIAGEKMRTTALYILQQWNASNGIVQVKFTNIGYTLSLGQPV